VKTAEQWLRSIALPGLANFSIKNISKSPAYLLELLINVQSRFNEAIRLSPLGNNKK
jgi:hypothetical protein